MSKTNVGERWRENLRDLYLTESPDAEGLCTGSILTSYGHFKFTQSKPKAEFYLATKESIEEFIKHTLEAQLDEVENTIRKIPIEQHICRFNDGDCRCECYINAKRDILAFLQSKRENKK